MVPQEVASDMNIKALISLKNPKTLVVNLIPNY